MENLKLEEIELEEKEDLLVKIEKSFDIKFAANELVGITKFGELCDYIADKIKLENRDDCTTQQAFYKLRDAIFSNFQVKGITTSTQLEDLFPVKTRRRKVKELERSLAFKLDMLTSPDWVALSLVVIFILSLISFFFSWKIALSGILFSIIGGWLSIVTANRLKINTVGQLAEKMARENYLKSRRDPNTFNKREIEKTLTDWFSEEFDLEKTELLRDAKLV